MKKLFFLGLQFMVCLGFAQSESRLAFPEKDSLYREDQIYISGTFHVIGNRPASISQSGFSGGIHAGFIRDMPINKKRTLAFGLGLGYSINTYNQNLLIIPSDATNPKTTLRPIESFEDVERNRFSTHLIEVPLEFRWRTSTPDSYKFWRIYAGVRLGYLHRFKASFRDASGNEIIEKKPDGLDRMRIGTTLTFGWNTFNFHMYYSLNPFFDKSVRITDEDGGISVIKLGLMFYIL